MKKLFAIALLASITTLAAPLQWSCDWPEAKSQTFSLYQGETATFEPTFRVNGRTVTNATIEAVWYTTNFVGTTGSPSVASGEGWWKLDGATFAPSNDVGAASYRFFVEAKASGDTIYRANGALRMLPSPGFTPNAIEPPVKTLDFATVDVLNPPWTDPDYSTNNTALVATIEATAPAPGDYATVSNKAMSAASRADVEAGWWSEWKILRTYNGATANVTSQVQVPFYDSEEGIWWVGVISGDGKYGYDSPMSDTEYVAELTWICGNGAVYTATRRRVAAPVPTKPEDIGAASPGTVSNVVTKAYVEGLGISSEETDPTIGLTNGTIYVKGSTITPLTSHQSLANYYNKTETESKIVELAPAPGNYSTVSNRAMTALQSYTESDPTISAWAKAASKPTYTASEVGAATTNALNTLSSQVSAISGHLSAEDARFVSTNYNSQVHLPEASVKVSVSNEWLTIWREMTRWDAFVGSGFDWTSWGGFLSWMSTTETALDQKADRAWGYYDSHTGEWAPEGYTQVSSSNILIAAGMGYQRTVSSGHTYWVLTANEPYEVSGISSNGFFRVADADGNVLFEIIKGDKRTVPAPPDGVSASGGVLTVSYPVASQPTVEVSLTLADGGTWYAEDSASCPATVAWSGTSGAYVATVTPSAPTAQLFVKASYQIGGETFINNRVPISITGGIPFNGTLYMPTVSGNELKFIAP